MEADEAEELGGLLAWPEDTAGGMMTTEFVAVPADLTAGQTIERLRELEPDAETIYYVYVVDAEGRLVGVLSLRDLIVAPPSTPIGEVMIDEPGRRRRAGRPRRRGRHRRPLQPAGRAGRRRGPAAGRDRHRRRRHRHDPAGEPATTRDARRDAEPGLSACASRSLACVSAWPPVTCCACAAASAGGAGWSPSWRSWARGSSPGSPATTPAGSRPTASWARRPASRCCGSSRSRSSSSRSSRRWRRGSGWSPGRACRT